MAWSQVGSLKGPKGDAGDQGLQGNPGRGITGTAINGAGELVVTFTDGATQNLGVIKGADGADGTSVTIVDNVADAASLPAGLTAADAGKGWITDNDGHLHVWSGTAFTDAGEIKGPKGDQGEAGDPGPRGRSFDSGNGAPAVTGSEIIGDSYVDLVTGTVYRWNA